jgi:hypothetical protein
MSNDAYSQARSSEGKGQAKKIVTFWAELWWPMEKNSHGEALVSPKCASQGECVAWVRRHKDRNGLEAQVGMWKRTSAEGRDYEDEPLSTMDAPMPSKEKVHALVEDLKKMIATKKRELDKGGPPKVPIKRPDTTMDPLAVRQLPYHEVYDENGKERWPVDAEGYQIIPEEPF